MNKIQKNEIKRKLVHLLSIIYVICYIYYGKIITLIGLVIIIFIVIIFENIRLKTKSINNFLKKNNIFYIYRSDEINKFSGLVWTLLGAFITILLFNNKHIIIVSFLYFIFGDASAALVGVFIGKHKIFKKKSLEGSLSCLVICFIVGLCIFNLKFALIGAIIAMNIEIFSWKLNDNFWMQIINTFILTLLSNFILWKK
jgi:dolichol kinase